MLQAFKRLTFRRGRLGGAALLSTVILTSVLAAPAGATIVFLSSTMTPGTVNQGDEALWEIHIDVDNESSTLHDATLHMQIDSGEGSIDLNAMKSLNGNICKKGQVFTEGPPINTPTVQAADCKIPDVEIGGSFVVKAVLDTEGVTPGEGAMQVSDQVTAPDETFAFDSNALNVNNADPNNFSSGFVPPGGTIDVGPGPKNLSTDNPVNGVVKLPKKILPPPPPSVSVAAANKPQPGPGASLSLSLDDPSAHPGACGGQDCLGKVLFITNPDNSSCSPDPPPCDILIGYNDDKHPVFVTVDFFGGTFPSTSTLYKIDAANNGTPIPLCIKSHGHYTNTPCIKKHKVKKSTGQITDVVALLQGDPGIPRR